MRRTDNRPRVTDSTPHLDRSFRRFADAMDESAKHGSIEIEKPPQGRSSLKARRDIEVDPKFTPGRPFFVAMDSAKDTGSKIETTFTPTFVQREPEPGSDLLSEFRREATQVLEKGVKVRAVLQAAQMAKLEATQEHISSALDELQKKFERARR